MVVLSKLALSNWHESEIKAGDMTAMLIENAARDFHRMPGRRDAGLGRESGFATA